MRTLGSFRVVAIKPSHGGKRSNRVPEHIEDRRRIGASQGFIERVNEQVITIFLRLGNLMEGAEDCKLEGAVRVCICAPKSVND